jgi:hypothetical protein
MQRALRPRLDLLLAIGVFGAVAPAVATARHQPYSGKPVFDLDPQPRQSTGRMRRGVPEARPSRAIRNREELFGKCLGVVAEVETAEPAD